MRKIVPILAAVILVCIGLQTYHGYFKEYFSEDEVLSYTLSNSRGSSYFDLEAGKWYSGGELFENLYVIPGHEFDWGNTLEKQMLDSHPPFYALALHFLSSFIPGRFSKWCGLGLNLICMALTLTVLFFLIRELLPERPYLAILVCGLVGMNAGIISLGIFIRMYILLMLFSVLTMWWHIRVIRHESSAASYAIGALITFGGIMTHYYFAVLTFYLAVFICIHFMVKKRIRPVFFYIGTMAAAAAVFFAVWHKALLRVGSDEVIQDAGLMGRTISARAAKARDIFLQTNIALFDGRVKILVIITAVYAVYLLVRDRDKLKRAVIIEPSLRMIVVVSILFYCTISIITPYPVMRYTSPVFPFVIFLAVLTLDRVVQDVFRSHVLGLALVALLFLYPELNALRMGLVDVNRQIIDAESTAHSEDICLFSSDIPPEENVFELRKFDRIFVYNLDNMDNVPGIEEAEEVVIYVPEDEDQDEYAQRIRALNPELKEMDRLYIAYFSTCYLMHK